MAGRLPKRPGRTLTADRYLFTGFSGYCRGLRGVFRLVHRIQFQVVLVVGGAALDALDEHTVDIALDGEVSAASLA